MLDKASTHTHTHTHTQYLYILKAFNPNHARTNTHTLMRGVYSARQGGVHASGLVVAILVHHVHHHGGGIGQLGVVPKQHVHQFVHIYVLIRWTI